MNERDTLAARPLTPDEEHAYRSITDLLPHQARRVWATLDAARAAGVRVAPSPDALDVERLARALTAKWLFIHGSRRPTPLAVATAIAREYDREAPPRYEYGGGLLREADEKRHM